MKLFAQIAVLLLGLFVTPAFAQGLTMDTDMAKSYGISELRAGVMFDDIELYSRFPIWYVPQPDSFQLPNIDTASVDVLFNTPDLSPYFTKPNLGWFNWLLDPRPTVGFDLNFKHESMIHASLNWHIPIASTGFFIEPELGGAVHNGELTGAIAPLRDLGCRALFYWSINVGYQINDNWNVMYTEQHASHDGLCGSENQGLNYEGIRVGYKF